MRRSGNDPRRSACLRGRLAQMRSDPRLRFRVFLLLLVVPLCGYVWLHAHQAAERFEARHRQGRAAAAAAVAATRQAEARSRLERMVVLLERRGAAPKSPAEVRERLLAIASNTGVTLPVSRFEPLLRPPTSTAGTEVRITVEGAVADLLRFLADVEGAGWPLRSSRVQLGVPSPPLPAPATLTAGFTILWPDPEGTWSPEDTARLVANLRTEGLATWLDAATSRSSAPPPGRSPVPLSAEAAVRDAPDLPDPTSVSAEDAPAVPASPRLHGFLDPGGGERVRAMLFFEGETMLVSVGDRLGDYTVVALEDSESVLLAHPDTPPLRLTLR